jgi:hypothetical protein
MKVNKTLGFILLLSLTAMSNKKHSNDKYLNGCLYSSALQPKIKNYVPDEKTAISIAEAVWLPIFGEKIYNSKPFIATLDTIKMIWTVKGTLNAYKGGVPYIQLQKSDAKIVTVYHTK